MASIMPTPPEVLIIALIGEGWGSGSTCATRMRSGGIELPKDRSWNAHTALGGTMLVLLGFLQEAVPGFNLYEHENREMVILKDLLKQPSGSADSFLGERLRHVCKRRSVLIAAHSHIIEFDCWPILLSFVAPYIYLSEVWKPALVKLLLAGSVILPVFVFA